MDFNNTSLFQKLKFDATGLIPAVIQDHRTGRVLMLAYMNARSLQLSLQEGETYFWSRSRRSIWHKGATSGNKQRIRRIEADCDGDTLLISVEPMGPACHTGSESCFFEKIVSSPDENSTVHLDRQFSGTVENLIEVIKSRKSEMPDGAYTTYLFSKGLDKILKKIGEESAETIIAAKNKSQRELTMESADLLYHLLVLFVSEGLEIQDVLRELESRSNKQKSK